MYDVVLFDLMNTVVSDPYLEALHAATGLDAATLFRLRDPGCWPDFELGAIDEAEFVRRFFPDPGNGHVFDIDAFHEARRAGYAFLPGMESLLASLDGRVRRYIASNYPVWIDELRDTFSLDRYFDGVYASCTLRARKPDARFFRLVLDDLGVRAQDCLFVDDRLPNCDAAQQLGMTVHHFDGAQGLRRRLAADGILPA